MITNSKVLQTSKWQTHVSDEEKQKMIAAKAYNLADERGFENFSLETDPQKDWVAAEEQVNAYLSERI